MKGVLKMKLLKKNQVIIYAIAVMLMVAGYLNYVVVPANLRLVLQQGVAMP